MSQTLILMNIKDVKMLIKLFNGCTFENGKFTNGRGQPLHGEPFIMTNRGPEKKDIYVIMSWGPHNVSAIASVEGHIDPDSNDLIIYNDELLPFLKNAMVENLSQEEEVPEHVSVPPV